MPLAGLPLDTKVLELWRMLPSPAGRKDGDEPSRTASAHPPLQAACSSSGSRSNRPAWGWSWARGRAGPTARSGRARHPPCLYPWREWPMAALRLWWEGVSRWFKVKMCAGGGEGLFSVVVGRLMTTAKRVGTCFFLFLVVVFLGVVL